jgi:urea transporter/tetratricopeptide (TPR) repeat protein/murein DD-endopeptidase MepM/ murein hydrolase activator NlpD
MNAPTTDRYRSIFGGCAEIFFLQGGTAGALFAAIMMLYPRQALPALVALAAAYGFAWLIGIENQFLHAGHFVYNPVLVGLSVGHLCELSPAAILLAALAGVIAFLITAVLARALIGGWYLPVLSLPFVLASTLVWIAASRYAHVLPPPMHHPSLVTLDLGLPLWINGLLRSFGAIVFAPGVIVGLMLALLVLRYSRILFLLAVAGYYLGTVLRGILLGSMQQALLDPNHFNFYLIAMALGGVFLIPSLRSGLVAMVAVAATALTLEGFIALAHWTGIPPFTLPFCTMTLMTICVLRVVNSPLLVAGFGRTPEEVRENWLVARLRYRNEPRTLRLPFAGKWTVWQGFNGRWTHQGDWRYAYDFVITDERGKTHRDEGGQLQDYYCYRMPVLSPIAGRVIRVVDNLADNSIGTVSGGSNWGNHVILHDPRGFYVEISHFTPQSIRVKEGEQVQVGSVLGLCGNSGYSPQPHIHVQVQATDTSGAATIPFSFVGYAGGEVYHAHDLPKEEEQVENLCLEKRLDDATNFVVDDRHDYEIFHAGRPAGQLRLRVRIAPDGTYYLETDRGQLYFGKQQGTFYFYRFEGDDPYLPLFMLAMPRLSLGYRSGMQWHDYVPVSLAASGVQRLVARLGSLVNPSLASITVTQAFVGRGLIESMAESTILGLQAKAEAELDSPGGILRLKVGDVELRQVRDPDRRARAARDNASQASPRSTLMASAMLSLAALAALFGAAAETKTDVVFQQAVQQSVRLEKTKDYAKAVGTLIAQYPVHRDDYFLNLRLGWLHYLNGEYADSDRYYQTAIRLKPAATEAQLGRLLPLLAESKAAEAETLARKILKTHPKSYYGNLRLAVALRLQKRNEEAREVVARMLAAYPADVYYLGEQALVGPPAPSVDPTVAEGMKKSLEMEAALKYADAIKALAPANQAHPRDYTLNLRLGWLHYLMADYRSSTQYYYTALQTEPKSIEAGLGYLLPLLAQGRYKDAESFARQIVDGDPDNYFGNVRLAFALRMLGRNAEAAVIVDRMLAANPAGISFLLERGMLDIAKRDVAAAREVFSRVLMLDPDNAVAKEQLRAL